MTFEEWWKLNHTPHAHDTDQELVEIIKNFSRAAWEAAQQRERRRYFSVSINKTLMLRNKHNLLQREVAELAGCSMYSVSRAERGGSPVVYEKILKVLGGDKIEPSVETAPREKPKPDKLLSARWIDTKTNWRTRYDKGAAA